ncbi:MAG: FHA domain-containing protein [Chloroflexia bacterium]
MPGEALGFSPAFQLQWVDRRGLLQSRPIAPPGLRLGRDPGNDIVLDDAQASRQHAFLWTSGGQVYVLDIGSANGTWVNGQRVVGPYPLQSGDRLYIGETTFTLVRPLPVVSIPRPEVWASPPFIPAAQPAAPALRTARPAGLTAGHLLVSAGTLIALIMFFLPWLHLAGLGLSQGYSAFEMMRMEPDLGLGEVAGLTGHTPPAFPMPLGLLILSPLTALLSLLLAAVGLLLKPRQRLGTLLAQFVAALPGAGIQVGFLASLQDFSTRLPPLSLTLDTAPALWCGLAGTALILIGSILDIALEFPLPHTGRS